jgi:outer membrane protein assembly factor BamA
MRIEKMNLLLKKPKLFTDIDCALTINFRFLFIFILSFISFSPIFAQEEIVKFDYSQVNGIVLHDTIYTDYIILKEIIIQGNNITRNRIILREIGCKAGDTIPAKILEEKLLWIKNRIFNTTLFLSVDVNLSGQDSIYKTLSITVRERFYFIPFPSGGLADRNFNEWWEERHHDLNRIDYGLNLKVKNMWGLNHTLKLKATTGFNKKLEANYIIPYIDKKLKTGLIINTLLVYNRQVAYQTYEHVLDYIETPGYGRKRFNMGFFLTRRNKFYTLHQLGPYFQYTSIADTIAKLNPNYFLNGATFQRTYGAKYTYTKDRRDFISYPLKGYILKTDLDFQHLISIKTMNVASLRLEYAQYIPLGKKIFFAAGVRGKISSPTVQPYYSQRGLGYNKDWVSGYELYVIDGQAYGLIKTNLKWQILAVKPTVKFIPVQKFKTIPLRVYLKIYSDWGYVVDNTYNPNNNFLSNRLLAGGGIGLDIVTYYDIVARIEYSINGLGQTGLFLNLKAGL